MKIEQELRERFVKQREIAILEINLLNREVQVCNKEGELLAIRRYSLPSPVGRVCELLAQLVQGRGYETNMDR